MELTALPDAQRAFFRSGATYPVAARKDALRALLRAIEQREDAICDALRADLGKSPSESYLCEIGLVKSEISYMLRHLDAFARERRVPTPLAHFPARSVVKPSPYGCVLIISPWNYPFLLTLDPLVDALAAGNTAVLKPSAYSPAVSEVLRSLIESLFPPQHVAVVTGGREENARLLELDFDYIFFTGSQGVGREVLRRAAERLIPVSLELGGKSPCIVDETADIPLAARRIVFGKFLNCGQTCVAPDYIYCHQSVKDRLIAQLHSQIDAQFGPRPLENPSYGRIVNSKHFRRLTGLLDPAQVVCGGQSDPDALRIAPTLLDPVSWDDPVMGEEIFGPLLPILTWHTVDEAVDAVRRRPSPLALYVFSRDKAAIARWKEEVSFGGGCVNDCLIHLATSAMGFGGVGESGMGAYHGKAGFDTFTHYKSMVVRSGADLPLRYPPYTPAKDGLIRRFLK